MELLEDVNLDLVVGLQKVLVPLLDLNSALVHILLGSTQLHNLRFGANVRERDLDASIAETRRSKIYLNKSSLDKKRAQSVTTFQKLDPVFNSMVEFTRSDRDNYVCSSQKDNEEVLNTCKTYLSLICWMVSPLGPMS